MNTIMRMIMANELDKYGGKMCMAGKPVNITPRNIRRLMKKFPNDEIFQKKLQEELDKYKHGYYNNRTQWQNGRGEVQENTTFYTLSHIVTGDLIQKQ